MDKFPMKFDGMDGKVLVIDRVKEGDADEVTEFIYLHLLSQPPFIYLIGAEKEDEKLGLNTFIPNYIRQCLSQPYSLNVRDQETGQLAAVRVNVVEERGEDEHDLPKSLVLTLLGTLNQDEDIFSKFQTDRLLHLAMIAVDKKYARFGLATKLNQLSMEIAVLNGAGAIKADAFSSYAARAALKLGFGVIKEIEYATFEYNGTTPLAHVPELLAEFPTLCLIARRLP